MSRGGQQKAMPKQFVSELVGKLNEHYQTFDIRKHMRAEQAVETNPAFTQRQKKDEVGVLGTKAMNDVDTVRKCLINSLTNWQRNQWARGGYSKKLKTIKQFAEMERRRTI